MKRLLRSKANLDILEGFLTEVLATNLKRGSWSGTCFSCLSHAGRGLQPRPKRLDVSIAFET